MWDVVEYAAMSDTEKERWEREWMQILANIPHVLPVRREETFMDSVGSYALKENFISHLLAFYADSRKPHGFGTLIANAFLSLAGRENETCREATVHREYFTGTNKRIDIVIRTDRDITIAVENKIGAGLYNDLDDYRRTLIRERKDAEKVVCFVLAPCQLDTGNEHWKSITYGDLWSVVRDKLGHVIRFSNLNWLSGLISLMEQTDSNMSKEHLNFDAVAYRYMIEQRDKIRAAISSFDSMRQELRNYADRWYSKAEERIKEQGLGTSGSPTYIECWRWNGDTGAPEGCQVFEFDVIRCAVDFYIGVDGVNLSWFARNNKGRSVYESIRQELSKRADSSNFKERGKRYFLINEAPTPEVFSPENLESVVGRVVVYIKTIQDVLSKED